MPCNWRRLLGGSSCLLSQVTYDIAMQYLPSGVQQVGTSLGSFSVSAALMDALLSEFAEELAAKSTSASQRELRVGHVARLGFRSSFLDALDPEEGHRFKVNMMLEYP